MTLQTLLEALKDVTEFAVKDLILPTARQDPEQRPYAAEEPAARAPNVYVPRVPDGRHATRKVPYVLHMVESCHDWQDGTHVPEAQVVIRSVLTVYSANEMEGLFLLYNLYEVIRTELMKRMIIGGQFTLDLGSEGGVHFTPYTQLEAPYFAGEMLTVWRVPGIRRAIEFEHETDPHKKCEGQGIHFSYGFGPG